MVCSEPMQARQKRARLLCRALLFAFFQWNRLEIASFSAIFLGTTLFPSECIERARDANFVAAVLQRPIPFSTEYALGPGSPYRVFRNTHKAAQVFDPQRIDDVMYGLLVHDRQNAKPFSIFQANNESLREKSYQDSVQGMNDKPRPFLDIAERLKWHRTLIGLNQNDYSSSIGVKRSAYSLWEAGTHRLSLDGALALRNKYGLSLDFMYEGIDDALPMTLRNAWIERS